MDEKAKEKISQWLKIFSEFGPRTAMAHLDARPISLDHNHFMIESTMSDAHRQPMGLLHGGISLLFAETVASFHSAFLCDLEKVAPVGVDINGTHLSSAKSGDIRITATLLRQASSFIFHEVEVYHIDAGRVLCKARVTNYLKPL